MHAQSFGEKEVVRELENDQQVSLEANVSRFSFIFYNLSGIKYFTSNHRSSQGAIYQRHLPWHYNDIRHQNDIVLRLIRATYYPKLT